MKSLNVPPVSTPIFLAITGTASVAVSPLADAQCSGDCTIGWTRLECHPDGILGLTASARTSTLPQISEPQTGWLSGRQRSSCGNVYYVVCLYHPAGGVLFDPELEC